MNGGAPSGVGRIAEAVHVTVDDGEVDLEAGHGGQAALLQGRQHPAQTRAQLLRLKCLRTLQPVSGRRGARGDFFLGAKRFEENSKSYML